MADNPRESQLVLLIDDDVMITEGLSAGLEREGRTVITCNDVESAQLIVREIDAALTDSPNQSAEQMIRQSVQVT